MITKLFSLIPDWAGLLFVALVIAKKQKKLSRELTWAGLRTTIQLLLLAFALEIIFQSTQVVVSLAVALVMTFNSSLQVVSRSKTNRYNVFWISFASHVFSLWPIAFLFSLDESPQNWLEPRMLLPLLGMILGNSLSGVSIALGAFMQTFKEKKGEILSLLALGGTIEESTRRVFFRSLKAGITPQINSMIAMGLVSIPGMMAGQLISQTSALDAATLQIKMMLSITTGTILCIYIALRFLRKKLFLPSGELCLE
jgi:putative ABC transport system permease protein